MPALAIRKTTWQGLSDRNKAILRAVGSAPNLGEPAEYKAPGGARWFVFDDHRFRMVEVAYFGCLTANLASIPGGYQLPMVDILDEDDNVVGQYLDRLQVRADAKDFCDGQGVVKPQDIAYPEEDDNPWQTTLDAQGAPAAVQMAGGVPDNWTVVEVAP